MNNKTHGSMFPTREQEYLLRAALLQGETALQAWQNWKTQVDIEEELDAGSYRLLPLLYKNLQGLGVDDPLMGKLKGNYRREWYRNQMLFRTTTDVLKLFHAAGIETIVLKGAALIVKYYKDFGLRPMNDFDVLIPTSKRDQAIQVLTQAGWHPTYVPLEKLTEPVLDIHHSWGFVNALHHQFDLHWHVFANWCYPNADDDFWNDPMPIQVGDVSTLTLNPTDHLLHICVHGVMWNPLPPVRWIADAMVILNDPQSKIDWSRLILQAKKRRLIFPLYRTLLYLRDSFNASIPSSVLDEISKVPVSKVERNLYTAIIAKPALLGWRPYIWHRYLFDLEIKGETNWLRKLFGFPRYLQDYKVMDLGQMMAWAIAKKIRFDN